MCSFPSFRSPDISLFFLSCFRSLCAFNTVGVNSYISYEIYCISYVRPRQMLTQTRTTPLFVLNLHSGMYLIMRLFISSLCLAYTPLSLSLPLVQSLSPLPSHYISVTFFFVYREKSEFSAYEIRFPIEFHVHIMNTQHYASVVCRRLIRKKSPKTISFIATRWKNTINIFHLKL